MIAKLGLFEVIRDVYVDLVRSSTGKETLSRLPRNKLALPVGLSAFTMAKHGTIDKNIMCIRGAHLILEDKETLSLLRLSFDFRY